LIIIILNCDTRPYGQNGARRGLWGKLNVGVFDEKKVTFKGSVLALGKIREGGTLWHLYRDGPVQKTNERLLVNPFFSFSEGGRGGVFGARRRFWISCFLRGAFF